MRLIHGILPILLSAACLTGARLEAQAASPRAPVSWRDVTGCYHAGDWHFTLDSIPFVGLFSIEDDQRWARSTREGYSRVESNWHVFAGDSVQLVFHGGMWGEFDTLAVRGDTLVGRSFSSTDVVYEGQPRPEGKVRAVREPCLPDRAYSKSLPDSAEQAMLFAYGAARPTDAQVAADPWGAIAPFRAWLQANPQVAAGFRMWRNARVLFERAATGDVRANHRELAGTYRLEIERTGGSTLVFYGRTEIRPRYALMQIDSAAPWADHSHGYTIRLTLTKDSASLPKPGPGRRHRDPFGSRFSPSNSDIDIRLPAADSDDGARRFRGSVMLVNFLYALRDDDRQLANWDHEWFGINRRERTLPDVAEFVLWPDGRVTFTQREELAPDRVVTIRGERISPVAWECSERQC